MDLEFVRTNGQPADGNDVAHWVTILGDVTMQDANPTDPRAWFAVTETDTETEADIARFGELDLDGEYIVRERS